MTERRMRRRREEIDPVTGEPLTPLTLLDLTRHLERRARSDRIESRVLYSVAVLLAIFSAFLFQRVQDLREARILDQGRTDRAICERQEAATLLLADTKYRLRIVARRQQNTARIVADLIDAVTRGDDPDPERRSRRSTLLGASRRLMAEVAVTEQQIVILRDSQRELERGVARVDCDKLPSARPFTE